MAVEIEAKIKVDELDEIRKRLSVLGAANEGEALEKNWVFDDDNGRLKADGALLRVRCLGEPGGILTVKRPTPGGDGEFKTREEVETLVDSVHDLLKQLDMLGYRKSWIYEKRRQTWLWHDCVLALDECPEMGSFVEIEGEPDRIREVCAELELDPDAHLNDNYHVLWTRWLEARGEGPRDMVFARSPEDKDFDWNNLADWLF